MKTDRKNDAYPQGILTCSVCGKEFKANDDTRYIINGGYTCTWKCFWNEMKRREAQKQIEKKNKGNKK